MKTVIVIVNYNNSMDTLNCLQSLKSMVGDFDVVVVDNASRMEDRQTLVTKIRELLQDPFWSFSGRDETEKLHLVC
jgi:GT2 family glycosyltransferase